jgi:phosphoribosylformylglycinamidine cyclo-ligase
MVIDKESWPVPEIFKIIQEKGNVADKEIYTVLNMGIGMILVVKPAFIKSVMSKLRVNKFKSWIIGEIVKSNTAMIIEN